MATEELLDQVNLRFVTDQKSGFTRQKVGKEFKYYDRVGKRITDPAILERIESLVIPPAWEDVWICPYANGYLQATGIDNKGRKQYRYHPKWNEAAQEQKFTHLLEFAECLPKIRRQVQKDMALPGLPREKVIATIVWLLENTMIRVGNEEYEKENKSYGLTTLKNKHVEVDSTTIQFRFKGKSGVHHQVSISDKRVAKVIQKCQDLPGQDLFEYLDEEEKPQTIDSYDVNEYLKAITDQDITAKDFRTWGGTVRAAKLLDKIGCCEDEKEVKRNITQIVKEVSMHLRNKPNTCRKYYIHPKVFEAYSKGVIISSISSKAKVRRDLNAWENRVTHLLEKFSL